MRRVGGIFPILRGAALAATLGLALPSQALAQQDAFPIPSAVLTLDQERLFTGSEYGQRLLREIEEASRELAAENRQIEAQLIEEERDLTEKRPTLPPADFRALADAFDAKAEEFRATQDGKTRALTQRHEEARQRFYNAALPILGELARDRGAVAVLNSQAVFLSFRHIDVTDEAISRLNATLGDGSDAVESAPAPTPAPEAGGNDTGAAPKP